MKLYSNSTFSSNSAKRVSPDPILSFFAENQEGIWHAAHLLGGSECARLVDRCVDLLVRDQRVTHRTRIMVSQILGVLALDQVDDPDLPYMGYFAEIDPCDPVVEEICLLADGLRRAVADAGIEGVIRPAA